MAAPERAMAGDMSMWRGRGGAKQTGRSRGRRWCLLGLVAALSVPAPLTLAGPASAEMPVGSVEPNRTAPAAPTAQAPAPDPATTDTTAPDTTAPESTTPESTTPETTTPETTTPGSTAPDTTVPGTPDTPVTTTPETTTPETTTPETTTPETTTPETTTPETTLPEETVEPPPVSTGDQCPQPGDGGTGAGQQPAGETGGSEPQTTTQDVTTVDASPVEGTVPSDAPTPGAPSPTTASAPAEPCPDPVPPATSTVTGIVWVDAGGDGFRATEPGRAEVRVELRTCEADPAVSPRTTVTDGNGEFRFEELPAGCYVVVVAPGEGRRFAARQSPSAERTASTVNANGRSQRIDLDGTGAATVNAALRPPRQTRPAQANRANRAAQQRARLGAITGVVWNDTDRDGIRGEEAGRPGVPVALRTCNSSVDTEPLATTTTDRNGTYRFAGLPVRCYLVTVGPDLDLRFSPRPDTGDDEAAKAEAEADRVLSGVKQTGVSDRIRVARGSTATLNAGITSPPPPPSAIPSAGNSPLLRAGIWMSPRWHRSAWPGLVAGPPAWTLAAAPPAPAGQSNTGSGVPMTISSSGLGPHGYPIVQVANEPDGTMTVPDRGVGWHVGTARPGEGGTVLLAAHVAFNGADGAFRHLATTRPGTVVAVTDDSGASHLYRVRAVEEYTKTALPLDRLLAPGPDGTETLLLVTCGGAFDPATRSYDTNVVVIAERVGPDSGAPWAAL